MRRTLRRCSLFAALLAQASISHAAPAPAAAASLAGLSLGGDRSLRIEADGRLVYYSSKGTELVARIGTGAPLGAKLRAVDATLIEATTTNGKRGRVMLLKRGEGQPQILFDEPVGPNADGELTRFVEISRDGAKRWQATPAVARCDGRSPLFLERFDISAKTWLPIAGEVPTAPSLAATSLPSMPPPRRALRFSAASTDGQSESADRLGAPRELDDGDAHTAWTIGKGAAVSGAFATARAPREIELVALKIAAPPAPARLPSAIVLIGGVPARARYRLTLSPAGASFKLPAALRGACVSIVVDDRSTTDTLAIGEVELYAADDQASGLSTLASVVASDGHEAEGTAHSLEEAGPAGADAALVALPAASPTGRLRLLRVIAARASALSETQLRPLGVLLETAHGDERSILVDIFALQPRAGLAQAARLLSDPSQSNEARADAIAILGRLAPKEHEAVTLLFDRLASADRSPALHALELAASRSTQLVLEAAQRLSALPATRADLVAIITEGDLHALSAADRATVEAALTGLGAIEQLPFELAVRVLVAMKKLGGSALVSTAGQALSKSADASLRRVAVSVLPSASDPAAQLLLSSAAADPDANVREAAMLRLVAGGSASSSVLIARAADTWPQVRRVAYEGMAKSCTPDLAALLERQVFGKTPDPDGKARGAALAAFSRCPQSTPEKIASAINVKQPIEVREEAAQVLGELGPNAMPLVTRALDRVFSHSDPALQGSALALLRALGKIGARRGGAVPFDDASLTLLRDSAADPFYPAVRIAAVEALSAGCPDGAHIVFDRADKDPEPAVQRASVLARSRCAR